MMTMGSAYYMLKEDKIGSLEEGKLADLVVLDKDFMKVPDEELAQINILFTMVDGKPMFAKADFAKEISWAGIPEQYAQPPEGVDEDKAERE
jgi:cytosine/adenosine deaminase-related metal-dependent hydrolase